MSKPRSSPSPLAGATMVGFLVTTDTNRCRAFYVDKLGFRVVSEDDLALTLDAVGNPIRIQKFKKHTPQQFTVLGWNVANLDAVLDELERAGVRGKQYGFPFQDGRGVASFPGGARVLWLEDPDGNIVSVAQMPEA
ncbi:MAG TPA: VOC family protein [Planctomycetota bacterium]|nr:VOC family protein [Planctomycetota bacterium]